jgi:hypothetical protein
VKTITVITAMIAALILAVIATERHEIPIPFSGIIS